MCGRIVRTSSRSALVEEFGVAHFGNVDLNPRYNIAPTQSVEAVIQDGAEKRMGPMRWGFTSASDLACWSPSRSASQRVCGCRWDGAFALQFRSGSASVRACA
jgi:putative SOS response-associated peptidase YedK